MTLAMNHLALDEETKNRISINYTAPNIATLLDDENKSNEEMEPVYSAVITKYKYSSDQHNDKQCYTWNISPDSDTKTDSEIADIKNGSHIAPIYFSIDQLKFVSYFYPNGKKKSSEIEPPNQVDWVLQLLSLSPTISNITIEFKVVLTYTNDCYSSNITFNHNNMTINFYDFIPQKDILNAKDLTFKIFMKTLEIRDQENKLQKNNYNDNISPLNLSYLPSASLVWSTKNEKVMNAMKQYGISNFKTTNIFNVKSFKFLMKIYPNGRSMDDAGMFCLELDLMTIPPKLSGFDIILNTTLVSNGAALAMNKYCYGSFNTVNNKMSVCCDNICSFEAFENMNEFQLNLEIMFVDVYNIKGDSVINAYNNVENDCKALVLPTKYHQWVPENTEEVLNAANTKYFQSDIFELQSFKWMLQVYPNGYTPSHKGQLAAFLYLAALSPKISKIIALIRLRIYGKGKDSDLSYSFLDTGEYNINNTKLGWITTGIRDIAYLSAIKELKFEVTVLIIDVFDFAGNVIRDYATLKSSLQNTLKTRVSNRTWAIHNQEAMSMLLSAENGESFESGFFRLSKLKWNMKLYPNGRKKSGFDDGDVLLQIQCQELIKPIVAISFMYTFYIEETETWFCNIAHFKHSDDDHNGLRDSWTLSHCKIEKLKSVEKLTVKLELKLLEVYADHNILMTHIY